MLTPPKQRARVQDDPIAMANRFPTRLAPRDASARASRARWARLAPQAQQHLGPTLLLHSLVPMGLSEEQQEPLKEAQTGVQQADEEQMATVVWGSVECANASAVRGALRFRGRVIEVLAHSLLHRSRDRLICPALRDERLTSISPTATAATMARNNVGRATREQDDCICVLSDAAHYDR